MSRCDWRDCTRQPMYIASQGFHFCAEHRPTNSRLYRGDGPTGSERASALSEHKQHIADEHLEMGGAA